MPVHLSARARLALARRPWLGWLIVAALAAGAAVAASAPVRDLEAARRRWGETGAVVVATRDGRPGDLVADLTSIADRPRPMVPATALARVDPGAVLRGPVAAGEILVATDVAARDGPQALIPPGWLGVPVAESVASGAAVGDRVSVLANGVVLADDGLVVRAGDGADVVAMVAVPADAAPTVAAGASEGAVLLLLRP